MARRIILGGLLVALALSAGARARAADPAALAAQLTDPDRREAAFCELLRLQRYRTTPRCRAEAKECQVSQVVVAPQPAGPPAYVVVRHTRWDTRLERTLGTITVIDGEGFIVPISCGNLGVRDEIIHYAGDDRIAIAHVETASNDDWTTQTLSVAPIGPEPRDSLRVVIGPPVPRWSETSEAFAWSWVWRSSPGSAPVLQIGPRAPDGQLAFVAAEFAYSEAERRYLGPAGGAEQGFLLLDRSGCCEAEHSFASTLGARPPGDVPRLEVPAAQREQVTPCAPGSNDHRAAEAALTALAGILTDLGSSPAQLDAANRRLSLLLATRCFRLSDEHPRSVIAPSALALRTWWTDGGEEWLRSYLELGAKVDDERWIVLPADMRPAARTGTSGSGLLVCRADEARCGADTKGWGERAMAAFRDHGVVDQQRSGEESRVTAETCAAQAGTGPGSYPRWRWCVEDLRPVQSALPLGGFRAPRRGWLVVTGRRGHYQFCDSFRAYHLATGAAYAAESCSALVLQPGGSVNHGSTDRRRVTRSFTGRVPADNLREAAWMTILADQVEPAQLRATTVEVPQGMAVQRTGAIERLVKHHGGGWGHSGQTRLLWWWIDGGKTLASGRLTWPDSSDAGKDHAVKLLDVAEQGMVEGPPGIPLPAWVLASAELPAVSGRDATPESLSATDRQLRQLLRKLATAPRAKGALLHDRRPRQQAGR